jgi:glycosyltransferase involved in cell wall biosynthesis
VAWLRSPAIADDGVNRAAGPVRLAYLVSHYPAISHAFLLREVEAMRALGATVETFSIRRTPAQELLSEADQRAFATTYSILPPRWSHLLGAHLRAILTRPGRYVRALATAFAMRRPGVRGTLWQLFYLLEAGVLWDRCRRAGIRHVHAQFGSNAPDVALLASELGGRGWTWSFTVHGPVEFYDIPGFRLPDKARRAAFVACTSDWARSQVRAFLDPGDWEHVELQRMGVDPARFTPDGRVDGGDGPMRILTVGRLAGVKGQAVLLDAMGELARRGVSVALTIAGDGPERSRLERRAAELGIHDRVAFVGAVANDRVADLYANADAFCTSSFAEGVPTVLMEAMACGLPVVATHIAGIPELVEDGVTGLLVPPARADALAAALERLATRPDKRAEMGRAARAAVVEERDERRSAARLLELIAKWGA